MVNKYILMLLMFTCLKHTTQWFFVCLKLFWGSLSVGLGLRLVSEPEGSACHHLPRAPITGARHPWLFLGSSCLHGKHFTSLAASPAPDSFQTFPL